MGDISVIKSTHKLLFVLIVLHASTTRAAVIPRLNNGESLHICAIGTSLTDASAYPPNWFAQTGSWLTSLYPGQVTLSNRAVGGSWSSSTNPRGGFLQLSDVLAYDNPDAVFIEFAINDAVQGLNISVAQSKTNLQTMINTLRNYSVINHKSVDVIVCTMNNTPYYEGIDRPNLAQYYQGYREVAATNHLLLVDNYPNWVNLYNTNPALWNSYVTDQIHPTSQGATAIILPEVQESLMSQVPEPGTWVMLLLAGVALMGRWCFRRRTP
jgi:lysophospholipase L1-like esterase